MFITKVKELSPFYKDVNNNKVGILRENFMISYIAKVKCKS